jgi:hypothetical protein
MLVINEGSTMILKDNVKGVYLTMEFDASSLLESPANESWMKGLPLTHDRGRMCCIDGKTADFKKQLGGLEAIGCNQHLISHLKYARSEGAKWVIFY